MEPSAVSSEHANQHSWAAEWSPVSQAGLCYIELLTDLKPFELLYMAEAFAQVPSQGPAYIYHRRLLMQFNSVQLFCCELGHSSVTSFPKTAVRH